VLATVHVVTPTIWERVRRVNPLVWDSLLAAACLVPIVLAGLVHPAESTATPLAVALVFAAYAPLALRRRAPLAVLAVVAAATIAYAAVGDGLTTQLALAIAAYTAAAHLPRRTVAIWVTPIAVVAALAIALDQQAHRNWVEVLINISFPVLLAILLGRIAFNRRARLARDRERAAADAVAEERARIARELHDVVAHAIGVMVVQAGAARTVVDRDPAAAKDAIAQVEHVGRDGLAEMRRLIGVLTDGDGAAARAPQPGLGALDDLVSTVRSAGLAVEVVRAGEARPLPAGADLTAYRVIQEALTNVLKHAGPAHARVTLGYDDGRLAIEVEDDGIGPSATDDPGHGLVGMRERVGLYGGVLRTGARPGGGFAVRAEIPFEQGGSA
jgi:signal transduction histidine kinase